MADLQFRYTILYVDNVPETLQFYEAAFGFKTLILHEEGDFGSLDTGHTELSFCSFELMQQLNKNPGQPNRTQPSFEIAFETTDVEAALSRALNAGATLVQSVEHMPWGQSTAYVTDANGFPIELCTPVSPAC